MDYKEHMTVECWKNYSTSEIIKFQKDAKKTLFLNTEWVMFYAFLILIIAGPTTILITRNSPSDFYFFMIHFIGYFVVWMFYIKKRVVNEDLFNLAKVSLEDFDTVLKYRKQNNIQ